MTARNGCEDCEAGRHVPPVKERPGECGCCYARVTPEGEEVTPATL